MKYIKEFFTAIWHLMQGMYISMCNMLRPKVTEAYPENRGKVLPAPRMRSLLTMPHNSDNYNKCTACGVCESNCPNGTIQVITKKVVDPRQAKKNVSSTAICTMSAAVSSVPCVHIPVLSTLYTGGPTSNTVSTRETAFCTGSIKRARRCCPKGFRSYRPLPNTKRKQIKKMSNKIIINRL